MGLEQSKKRRMDWARLVIKLTGSIEFGILLWKKYWKSFLGPYELALWLPAIFLTGQFISRYSTNTDYLAIVLLGSLLAQPFYYVFYTVSYLFGWFEGESYYHYYLQYSNLFYLLLTRSDILVVLGIFYTLALFFVSIFHPELLATAIKSLFFVPLIIMAFASTALMSGPIAILSRSEVEYAISTIGFVIVSILPVYYELSKFWFYPFLVIFPPAIFIEEARRFLLNKPVHINLALAAFAVTLAYFIIGNWLIRKAFNYARRKGLVFLR